MCSSSCYNCCYSNTGVGIVWCWGAWGATHALKMAERIVATQKYNAATPRQIITLKTIIKPEFPNQQHTIAPRSALRHHQCPRYELTRHSRLVLVDTPGPSCPWLMTPPWTPMASQPPTRLPTPRRSPAVTPTNSVAHASGSRITSSASYHHPQFSNDTAARCPRVHTQPSPTRSQTTSTQRLSINLHNTGRAPTHATVGVAAALWRGCQTETVSSGLLPTAP